MRRYRILTVMITLLCMMIVWPAMAAEEQSVFTGAEITVSDLVFHDGGEAQLTVTLDKAPENGLYLLILEVACDADCLQLTDIDTTGLAGDVTRSLTEDANPCIVMWDALDAVQDTGLLMTLTFKAETAEAIPQDVPAVTITCRECLEADGLDTLDAECRISDFGVYNIVSADLNSDGSEDMADCLYLLRHSLLPERYPLPADGNGDYSSDGIVTGRDAELLYKALQ